MLAIHGDKLRWLFWLRWKLLLRAFSREKSRIITTIFLIVFGIPFYAAIAVGTFFGYRLLPFPANAELLFLVLTGIYLLWMVMPLLEFTVNEGLDISKLMLFPLTRPELMVSLLLSTLLDIPMFGLLLVFIAVVVGWAVSVPVTLLAIVAVLIFYTQVVGMSQLVLALLMRTLQSRRFRDLSIILIAAFSSLCYLFQQFAFRAIGTGGLITNLRKGTFSSYLQWLPPGMTARAIEQAATGNWGLSFAWLAASLIASILVLYLWPLVLERSLSSPETGGVMHTRSRRAANRGVAGAISQPQMQAGFWERIRSTQTFSITIKEWKYFWRDPQLKALLFQSVIYIALVIVGPLFGSNASRGGLSTLVFVVPLAVFISVFTLSYNTLGMERQSLTTLFLFPIDPRHILLGKNIAVATLGVVELVLLVVFSSALSHNWNFTLPVLIIGLAGIGVVISCGNISSVFFPTRMRQIQRGMQATGTSSANTGCIRSLMSLAIMIATFILLMPVAASVFLPLLFHMRWIWIFSIPAALLYATAFYLLVLWQVAPRLLRRAPEILAVVTARE